MPATLSKALVHPEIFEEVFSQLGLAPEVIYRHGNQILPKRGVV